jgi:hypothetical protein
MQVSRYGPESLYAVVTQRSLVGHTGDSRPRECFDTEGGAKSHFRR